MSKFQLADHQTNAVRQMKKTHQLGIFYEAGCGKTMCVLDLLYQAFKEHRICNALIICPASIVTNWQASIKKMRAFEGYTEYGVKTMYQLVTIRSYQMCYTKIDYQVHNRDGSVEAKKKNVIRPDILHPWGAIVIDESQGLGDANSTQTNICLQLANLSERRYILSGTPVSGGGGAEDYKKLYGQLKFLNPELWPDYGAFCQELVTKVDYFGKPKAYRKKECETLLRNYGLIARLDDCYDMPESMDMDVVIESTVVDDYVHVLKGETEDLYGFTVKTGGGYFVKLLELVSGFLLGDDGKCTEFETNKPDAVETIISGTNDKVVIFCNYSHSIDLVKSICAKHGKTVTFDGRSKGDSWREFQYGNAKYLVCQYQSGGVGIDLFASHTTIFFEPSLSSLLMEQAKARTRRKGQKKKCLYYWIATKGTIEEKVIETVKSGVEVTRDLLEKWADSMRREV